MFFKASLIDFIVEVASRLESTTVLCAMNCSKTTFSRKYSTFYHFLLIGNRV